MKPEESPIEEPATETPAEEPVTDSSVMEYDVWRWHTEGKFPDDQPPEQGYVHIGVFIAWLASHDMLDEDWIARSGVARAVAALRDRSDGICALRDMTDGRLASDMLTAEGQAFTSAYYAPEYGYPSDWRRVFGRAANHYAVPEGWETYDRMEPLVELRYHQWVDAGSPELMPLPRLLDLFYRLVRRGERKG
jgi:hypothetical protein